MLQTEEQRRWWFATHPEFSSSHKKGRARGDNKEEEKGSEKYTPEDVDAYVDEQLKYATGREADFLKIVKRVAGTEGASKGTTTSTRDRSRLGKERREFILRGEVPAQKIELDPNPNANPNRPPWEIHDRSQVPLFDTIVEMTARKYGIDADLVRAIMYMETTHGWYDRAISWADQNKSILPMNVYASYWRGMGYTREQLKDPRINIDAGVRILKGIISLLDHPSVENVATLYKHLGATQVSNYGARVNAIYKERLWLKK
jgi:hypothetical protein